MWKATQLVMFLCQYSGLGGLQRSFAVFCFASGDNDFTEFGERGVRASVMGREVPTYCVRRTDLLRAAVSLMRLEGEAAG